MVSGALRDEGQAGRHNPRMSSKGKGDEDQVARREEERAWLASIASAGPQANTAMNSLFQRYQWRFKAYLRSRWFADADVDEVTQQAWVDITRKARTFDATRVPEAWLWGFVKNGMKDVVRRRAREADRFVSANDDDLNAPGDDEASPESPEAHRSARDLRECVERAFDVFKRQYRHAAWLLYLAYVDRLDIDEVAEYRGTTRHAAEEFISRARKLFRPHVAPCLELRTG